jgi:phospholipid/cholesterol/gamma-HCH transport system substrate-binding protein
METKANHTLIGLFTLVVLASAFAFIYWLVTSGTSSQRADVIYHFQGAVTGLTNGSPVYFNGIKVGEVIDLSLDVDNPQQAIARAEIDLETPVKKDTQTELGIQGLTGIAYVDMRGGSPDKPDILNEDRPVLIIAKSGSIQDIVQEARRMMQKADTILDNVQGIVEASAPVINNTLTNAEVFSQSLANNAEGIDRMLASISSAADSLSAMSSTLDRAVTKTETILDTIDPQSVEEIVANLEQTSKNFVALTSDAQNLVQDGRQILSSLNEASLSLVTTMKDVQGLVSAVDQVQIQNSLNQFETFAESLPQLSADIQTTLSSAKSTASNFEEVSQTFVNNNERIDQALKDASTIAMRLEEASRRIDGILQRVDSMLGTGSAESLMQDARDAARSLKEMADNLSQQAGPIADNINRFTRKGLGDVEALVQDGRQVLNRMEKVLSDFEKNPQRLLFGGESAPEYEGRRR